MNTLSNNNHRTPLSSNIRQERDRRIDEILSGRTTPSSFTSSGNGSPSRQQRNDNNTSASSSDEESGLQVFGETLKSKLNTLFTKKNQDVQSLLDQQPQQPSVALPPPQQPPTIIAPQQQHYHHQQGPTGFNGRTTRVLGRPTSPDQQQFARSRSPSPTRNTRFPSHSVSNGISRDNNHQSFARYDPNNHNNNMFNDI